MARGISEGASKKNLVVFLFGDVFGHSFFFLKNIRPRSRERLSHNDNTNLPSGILINKKVMWLC